MDWNKDNHVICVCQYTTMTSIGRELNRIERLWQYILRVKAAITRRCRRYCQKVFESVTFPPRIMKNQNKNQMKKYMIKEGDMVMALSYKEIQATLDERGRCNGLEFIENARSYCLKKRRVLKIPEYILDQGGKRINRCRNLVIIEGLHCNGKRTVLQEGCDRYCLHYWKTDWLRKVS